MKLCEPERIEKRDGILDPGFDCSREIGTFSKLPERCKIINVYANATENEVKIILPVSR